MEFLLFSLAFLLSSVHVLGQLGIAYSPYYSNQTCKTQTDVNTDFGIIFNNAEYGYVRTYGTDCYQTALVLNAIIAYGMQGTTKLFAGIYDPNDVDTEANNIINDVNSVGGDWSMIDTVGVGNEGLADGQYTLDEVTSAISEAQSTLGNAGYGGSVVTVEIFYEYLQNTSLCSLGDYVATNCHPFFDGGVTADGAAGFVSTQLQNVINACPDRNVIITETGWPSQGETNNQAVPSEDNQQLVISDLKSTFSSGVYLFEAFNDYWKQDNSGTFGTEHYWGFLGDSPSSPPPSSTRKLRRRRYTR